MEKYINKWNKECWRGVVAEDTFSDNLFHKVPDEYAIRNNFLEDRDYQWAFHSNLGSITVLDGMTGFGWRDVETGYRDNNGEFWLASGNFDIRCEGVETIGEAIEYIKRRANTCIGTPTCKGEE